jgi:DNA-binding GntR family transcriptional regulator
MPSDSSTPPLPLRPRGRLTDEVGERLAEDIVLGRLEPGSRLDEAMLATRYGVSRTPVREALKQLVTTGLVVYRPNRGASVAAMTPEQLDAMFETIGELEAACARHAAVRMDEAERRELARLHTETRQALQSSDVDAYDRLNQELHLCLLHGSHNPVLVDTAKSLRSRVAPFRRTQFRNVERMAESFAEHVAIVEAVLARDAVGAYREMRNHLFSARGAAGRLAPAWTAPRDA